MTQLVKYLVHEYEDCRSIASTHVRKSGAVVPTCSPSAEDMEMGGSKELDGQLVQPNCSTRAFVSKNKLEND